LGGIFSWSVIDSRSLCGLIDGHAIGIVIDSLYAAG
jgi:hypothetical protein